MKLFVFGQNHPFSLNSFLNKGLQTSNLCTIQPYFAVRPKPLETSPLELFFEFLN